MAMLMSPRQRCAWLCSGHIWSTVKDAGQQAFCTTSPQLSAATTVLFSFSLSTSLVMSHYPEVGIYFIKCPTIRLFWRNSPTKASKGITATVIRPIHRRAIMISRTMPRIPSQLLKITRATRNMLKTINQIIRPRAKPKTLSTCPTTNHPHRVTPNHILRLLTPKHRHLRSCISNNSHMLLSPMTNPSGIPTSPPCLRIR